MVELPAEIAAAAAQPGAAVRRPAAGYAMVAVAATLWAVNGAVAKVILAAGLPSLRLTELRSTGAAVGFGLVLALTRPRGFRVRRSELPRLVFFGVVGLTFVQLLYFVSIHRLNLGVALLIEYLAPLFVALWPASPFTSTFAAASGRRSPSRSSGWRSWSRSGAASRSTGSAWRPRSAPRSRSPSTC